jgi:hypothetical protein
MAFVVSSALLQIQGFSNHPSATSHSGLSGPSLVVAILAITACVVGLAAILWTVYEPRILVLRTERWLRKRS